jgi:copper(I)-binding protein
MKRVGALLAGYVAVLAACGTSPANVAELSASGAWARATPVGATNGVVYLQVTSPTDGALASVSVPASVAAGAELHETMGAAGASPMANMPQMGNGTNTMTMAPLDSVALPADSPVVFEPGGKHIMLVDLTAPLEVGQTFTLTLTLADGTILPVDVVVADNAPST